MNKAMIIAAVVVIGGGAALYGLSVWQQNADQQPISDLQVEGNVASASDASKPVPTKEEARADLASRLGVGTDEFTTTGGIVRPTRDLAFEKAITKTKAENVTTPLPFAGNSPALEGNENTQVANLYKEISGPEPEKTAISTFFMPEKFDRQTYEANPQQYLDKIRPGRVFQPAQPAPDVKPIESESKPFETVLQGESVVLRAKATPGSPVTFYTQAVGEFPNRLTTYNVEADENGIAEATYTATSGTNGLVEVLAASPVNSGQLRFRVNVKLADPATK